MLHGGVWPAYNIVASYCEQALSAIVKKNGTLLKSQYYKFDLLLYWSHNIYGCLLTQDHSWYISDSLGG